jgi:hypothetical protein
LFQEDIELRDRQRLCRRTVLRRSRKLTMLQMSSTEELNQRLRELDAEFDLEMRARGFDSAQAENVALPTHLAALYIEREQIKAKLEELEGQAND